MNDTDRIKEHIKRMRTKGVEPEIVYIKPEFWDSLGKPRAVAGVCFCESDRILGKFEVR